MILIDALGYFNVLNVNRLWMSAYSAAEAMALGKHRIGRETVLDFTFRGGQAWKLVRPGTVAPHGAECLSRPHRRERHRFREETTLRRTTLWLASLAILLVGATAILAGAAVAQESSNPAREALERDLPENFPLPARAQRRGEARQGSNVVEVRVQQSTQKNLREFFQEQLPKRGFKILAQNPPRVFNDDSPVTYVVERNGQQFTLQLSQDQQGARFTVRGRPGS